ncbi:MAG: hypothetical protein J5902_07650 [Paludibacteraceae bacterium]|nr:hypothetical protein [Paludibacteraceae bacterium]
MKRFFSICLMVILTIPMYAQQAASASSDWDWQDHRSTLSISAGYVSGWYLMEALVTWIPAAAEHAQKSRYYGAYGLQYHYQNLWWLRSGFKLTCELDGHEIARKQSDDTYQRVGKAMHYTASAMASVQFTYMNLKHVQLYSGIDAGLGVYVADKRYDEGYTDSNNNAHPVTTVWLPAFNLTAFGVAAGGEHVFGLFELNLGYEAFAKIGLGVHL